MKQTQTEESEQRKVEEAATERRHQENLQFMNQFLG